MASAIPEAAPDSAMTLAVKSWGAIALILVVDRLAQNVRELPKSCSSGYGAGRLDVFAPIQWFDAYTFVLFSSLKAI